ncbi:MAG: lysophospholipid acyltransferase family protein, partial [Candidatus Korobacteraceae bacterium]
ITVETKNAERTYSFAQRLSLALASWLVPALIALFGCTLRVRFNWEEGSIGSLDNVHPGIYPFWHRCVFASAWIFRKRKLAVMTSRSLDGEYIARVIQRLGFVPIRGSSSRGGQRALLGMQTYVDSGMGAAFTIDGPRGPRYVAKRGPVYLAKATGVGITPFYVAVERKWTFNSWDRFVIPVPFSRALVQVAPKIYVARDADDATLEAKYHEMQSELERITEFAEGYFSARSDEE